MMMTTRNNTANRAIHNTPISSVTAVDNLLRAATEEYAHLSLLGNDPYNLQKPPKLQQQQISSSAATSAPLKQQHQIPSALKKPPPSQQQQRQKKKNIRFPQDESHERIYHEGPDIDLLIANRRDLWYQQEELKHMKRKALVVSKEAQRYGLGSILTNTYSSQNSNLDEVQQALNTWSRNGTSRRGLERWINDEYAAKRSDIRKRTIQSVLRAQQKMRQAASSTSQQQHDASTSPLLEYDYACKVLSRLSEAFSVDSKHFARSMGIADELAIQEQEQYQPAAAETASSLSRRGSSGSGNDSSSTMSGRSGGSRGSGHRPAVARRGSGSTRHYGSSSYASRKHMTGQRRSLGLVAASTVAAPGAIVGGGGAGSGAQDLRHYC